MLQTSRTLGYHVPRADLTGCSVCSTTQCLQPAAFSPCPRSHSRLYKAGSSTRLRSQSASISWFFAVKVFRGITQPQPAHQGMHVASKTSFLGAKQKLILFHPAKYIKLWAPTNKTCFTVPILPNKKSIPFGSLELRGARSIWHSHSRLFAHRSAKDAASPGFPRAWWLPR